MDQEEDSETIAQRALNVLECPVCVDYMIPPIKQCIQGHSLCDSCRNRCEICPCCRSPFANTRNIALESLASAIPLPCPNAIWGCTKVSKIEERNEHKSICCFKAITCNDTTAKCSWTGTLEQYKEHCCLPSHLMVTSGAPVTSYRVNKPYFCFNITAVDEIFLFKQKFVEETNTIYWTTQFIGHPDRAANYVYEINISSALTSKKATFQQACQSIYLEDKDLFNEGNSILVSTVCIMPIARSMENEIKFSVSITRNELTLFYKFLEGTT